MAQPRAPVQQDTATGHRTTLLVHALCSAVLSITWHFHFSACHTKRGEANAAIDCAGSKPHKAKYSEAVILPTLSFKPCAQTGDVNMKHANTGLPHCEAIYYKGCMV